MVGRGSIVVGKWWLVMVVAVAVVVVMVLVAVVVGWFELFHLFLFFAFYIV